MRKIISYGLLTVVDLYFRKIGIFRSPSSLLFVLDAIQVNKYTQVFVLNCAPIRFFFFLSIRVLVSNAENLNGTSLAVFADCGMRSHHGSTTDGMAKERQGDAVEQNAGVWLSRLVVRGRTVVFAPHQTNLTVRQ